MKCTHSLRGLTVGLSLGFCVLAATGCESAPKKSSSDTTSANTMVISRQQDSSPLTMVRVYSLRGVGLNNAPPQDIQAFMDTMQQMVVSNTWEKTSSSIQVFGRLMTVRTTPENHLVIERYLNDVRRAMQQPEPLTMNTTIH